MSLNNNKDLLLAYTRLRVLLTRISIMHEGVRHKHEGNIVDEKLSPIIFEASEVIYDCRTKLGDERLFEECVRAVSSEKVPVGILDSKSSDG